MKRKIYEVKLKTIGPTHVGTGEILDKSQYLYDFRDKKVYIPDERKFFNWIIDKELIDSYERFIMGGRRYSNLFNWIDKNNLKKDFLRIVDYTLDTSSIYTSKDVWFNDIAKMIKDKDNNPYIPGSSLKGFIRNAIINYEFNKLRIKDSGDKKIIIDYYNARNRFKNRRKATNDLSREGNNLVNRILKDKTIEENKNLYITRNILISDSEPVSKENLILSQKIDTRLDKKENKLPIFRECIKPNTELEFQMVIKENSYIDIDYIIEAIETFYIEMDEVFLQYFGIEEREELLCYIGGGAGFLSKTAIYSLFNEEDGKKVVNQIMKDNFPKGGHNQGKIEVSPKTLKQTKYRGKKLEMGICSIEFKEKDILY